MTCARVFESNGLPLMRRNRWLLGLTLSPLLAALALGVAALVDDPAYLDTAGKLALLGCSLTFFAYRWNWRSSFELVSVRADAEGVTLGERFVPRAAIRAGLVSRGVAPRVLLRFRFRFPVELQTGSDDEARALLFALGLDASQTVASFRALSPALARRRYALCAWLAILCTGLVGEVVGGRGRAMVPVLWVLIVMVFFVPARIHVSAAGVLYRWLWRRQYIALQDIENVTQYEKHFGAVRVLGLRVWLRSAELLAPIAVQGRTAVGAAWGEVDVGLIWERIREAMVTAEQDRAAAGSSSGPSPHVAIEKSADDDKESPLADRERDAASAREQRETGRKSE